MKCQLKLDNNDYALSPILSIHTCTLGKKMNGMYGVSVNQMHVVIALTLEMDMSSALNNTFQEAAHVNQCLVNYPG